LHREREGKSKKFFENEREEEEKLIRAYKEKKTKQKKKVDVIKQSIKH
jgi:hypothetical protein